jgi:predicted RNA-binding protein Jag
VFIDGLGELTEEEAAFLRRLRGQLGALAEGEGVEITDEPWDHRRQALTRLVASELGFYHRDLDPAGVFVGNMSDFVERTRRRLKGIEPGESLEFEKELNITQRQVVHWLAADLGLWTMSQGRGASRQVVAFNVGSFAEEVRRRLQALAPGATDRFSTGLSSVQRRIVHLIAEELGLWTHSAGVGGDRYVEVFNLKAFALQVRQTLEALGPGQNHDFAPTLSKEERKVVHCTATELGLVSLSQENSEGKRYVSAGNLHDFRGQVRNQMEQMDKGESKAIQASGWGTAKFTMLQLKAIKLAARDLGMSQSEDGGGGEQLQVTSPQPAASIDCAEAAKAPEAAVDAGHDAEKDGRRKRRKSSSKERRACTKEGLDEDDEVADFFDEMCTGSYNGQKLFTSLVDLKALLNELHEVMPVRKQRLKKEWARLESLFEDTVQLQVDFGTRTRKGLTYQWFQTFIQKVARHFDMSVMGMLLLLNPDLD